MSLRARAAFLARVLVSVALLAFLLHTLDVAAIQAAIARVPWWALGAALAILLAQILVLSWRWRVITTYIGGDLSFRDALRLTFVGLFFSQTLPTSIGGDAMRIWEARRAGLAGEQAMGGVIIERLTGLVAIALVVTLSMPLVWADFRAGELRWLLLALAPAALALLAVLAFVDRLPLGRLPTRVREYIAFVASNLRGIGRSATSITTVFSLGAVAAMLGISSAYAVGRHLGIELGLPAYLVSLGGAVLLTVVPVSVAGWGVREVATVGLFGAMGVPAEKALVVSLLYGVGVLVVSLPGGLLWHFARRPDVAYGK